MSDKPFDGMDKMYDGEIERAEIYDHPLSAKEIIEIFEKYHSKEAEDSTVSNDED